MEEDTGRNHHPRSAPPTTVNEPQHSNPLLPADAAALDALVQAGFDAGHVQGCDKARANHIADLLALTSVPGMRADSTLIDVTIARIMASGETRVADEVGLSSDDAEALDALVNAGFQTSRVAPSLRARAAVVDAMRDLVTQTPAYHGDRAALIERTVKSVQEERAHTPIPIERGRPLGGFRLADIASVAAVLVLGASVLFPVMSSWNTRREKTACVANLGGIAGALGAYSSDFSGRLPVASASTAGGRWWDVGQDVNRSNSANLFALRRNGYTTLDQLSCSGNPNAVRSLPSDATDWQNLDQVSYSYYVMFASQRPNWRAPNVQGSLIQPATTVVLTDASPVIRRALQGGPIYVFENSPNHEGSGQWAVHADGSASWMQTPLNGSDNIWLPANLEEAIRDITARVNAGETSGSVEVLSREGAARQRAIRLNGNEAPASTEDSFVGP